MRCFDLEAFVETNQHSRKVRSTATLPHLLEDANSALSHPSLSKSSFVSLLAVDVRVHFS
jgi:hypothetical protein